MDDKNYKLIFPSSEGMDFEYYLYSIEMKECCLDAQILLADGRIYNIIFVTINRIKQEMGINGFYFGRNVMVIDSIILEKMLESIDYAFKLGGYHYFDY